MSSAFMKKAATAAAIAVVAAFVVYQIKAHTTGVLDDE